MRFTIYVFLFLAFAPLAQTQVTSSPPVQARKQTICQHMLASTDDKYYRGNVRSFLDLAKRGFSYSSADQAIQNMGDGASIAVLKIIDPSDLQKSEFVKAYLELATTAFSQPELTVCAEDRSAEVTLFLLNYLREKVTDGGLQRQIDSTREYVIKQAGPTRQSPFPEPSPSAK